MADPPLPKTKHLFKRSRGAPLLAGRACRFAAAVAAAAIVIATAVPPAFAGMCDQPPYAQKPEFYQKIVELFGRDTLKEFLSNVCRVKYYGDEKTRKAMVDIGITPYEIDHEDVGLIALKVLQELQKCMDAHHGDASGC